MPVTEIVTSATAQLVIAALGDEARTLAEALTSVNERLPVVVGSGEGHGLRMQEPDRRLSWGIARRQSAQVVRLLVERDNSKAMAEADSLAREFPKFVDTRVIGRAQSAKPEAARRTFLAEGLYSGASIGHYRGTPGSIGALVKSRHKKEDWLGVTSAAHVLGRGNQSQKGEQVLAPGPPDGPRTTDAVCGHLERYNLLTHFSQSSPGDNYLCCADLAVVRIAEECEHERPGFTSVVDPATRVNGVRLRGSLSQGDAIGRIDEFVYKVGRTSDLTRGRLDLVGVQRQAIQLPDGRVYLYSDVLVVRGTDGEFSQPGDSGALVYTHDFHALGFVIGGAGDLTFVSPVDTCLEELKLELVL